MAITTANGLLYRDGRMLSVQEADAAASLRGFNCAEQLVRHLEANPPACQKCGASIKELCICELPHE